MKFPVLSNDEIAAQRGILKEGKADFEVVDAVEQVSKTGNDMIKLTLKVWDSEGRQGTVFDYLVSNSAWKIKNFFESIGHPEIYTSGEISSLALPGKSGKAEIIIKKDKTYGDQSKIKDYILGGAKPHQMSDDADWDEIPL